jgi:hypothetical protein
MPDFVCTLAMNVRAYADVVVVADSLDEALEKLRASAAALTTSATEWPESEKNWWEEERFEPEFGYLTGHTVVSITGTDVEAEAWDIQLYPADEPCRTISAADLARRLAEDRAIRDNLASLALLIDDEGCGP